MSKECSRTERVEHPGSRRKGRSTAHRAKTDKNTSFSSSCFWWSLPTQCQSDTDRCRFNTTNRTSRETRQARARHGGTPLSTYGCIKIAGLGTSADLGLGRYSTTPGPRAGGGGGGGEQNGDDDEDYDNGCHPGIGLASDYRSGQASRPVRRWMKRDHSVSSKVLGMTGTACCWSEGAHDTDTQYVPESCAQGCPGIHVARHGRAAERASLTAAVCCMQRLPRGALLWLHLFSARRRTADPPVFCFLWQPKPRNVSMQVMR